MATTVDFVHAYTAVNNSGLIILNVYEKRSFVHNMKEEIILLFF